MKILFVCSGNHKYFGVSPFIISQAKSLIEKKHQVDFYTIKGKGIINYLRSTKRIYERIYSGKFDIVHAHYSLCGFIAYLAYRKPMVVSLMGSDVHGSLIWKVIVRFFSKYLWSYTIVKSEEMKRSINLSRIQVIPNGVDIREFRELPKSECRKKIDLTNDKKYVLFAADPNRKVKNYDLAKKTIERITETKVDLITLGKTEHSKLPLYINASDVVILTSLWEGSPNIVKEAMACNIPIVSTDVGDVKWLFSEVDGYYIAEFEPVQFAQKLQAALEFKNRTKGRDRILELELDSVSVATRLICIYQGIVFGK